MSKKLTQMVDGARDLKNAKKIAEGIDHYFGGTDGIVAAGIPIVKAVAAGEKVITTTKTVKAVGLGAVGALGYNAASKTSVAEKIDDAVHKHVTEPFIENAIVKPVLNAVATSLEVVAIGFEVRAKAVECTENVLEVVKDAAKGVVSIVGDAVKELVDTVNDIV